MKRRAVRWNEDEAESVGSSRCIAIARRGERCGWDYRDLQPIHELKQHMSR
jgi:hypothetical protein